MGTLVVAVVRKQFEGKGRTMMVERYSNSESSARRENGGL